LQNKAAKINNTIMMLRVLVVRAFAC